MNLFLYTLKLRTDPCRHARGLTFLRAIPSTSPRTTTAYTQSSVVYAFVRKRCTTDINTPNYHAENRDGQLKQSRRPPTSSIPHHQTL